MVADICHEFLKNVSLKIMDKCTVPLITRWILTCLTNIQSNANWQNQHRYRLSAV